MQSPYVAQNPVEGRLFWARLAERVAWAVSSASAAPQCPQKAVALQLDRRHLQVLTTITIITVRFNGAWANTGQRVNEKLRLSHACGTAAAGAAHLDGCDIADELCLRRFEAALALFAR